MREIITAISNVKKLCGKKKVDQNTVYRMSNHCIVVSCPDGTLYYHTLLGCIFLEEKEESEEKVRKELIENRFLVAEDFSENEYADKIKQIVSAMRRTKKHKKHFTVSTTTNCNARCSYCYECGWKRLDMTEDTAREVAEYMISASGEKREIKISWFGGEPLYNYKAIDLITDILKKNNIAFHSTVITNGFYLTKEILEKARNEWRLEKVQITLDGTEEVYNRTKAYVDDCKNPFERVINNITGCLSRGVKVVIRLNVDKKNAEDMSNLIDFLGIRFKGEENFSMYVAFLKNYNGRVDSIEDEEEKLSYYFRLRDKIKSYGLLRNPPLKRRLQLNNCMADNDACECIYPDGSIGKCEHFFEGEQIGTIYNDIRDEEKIASWKEVKKDYEECKECTLYPLCTNLKKCEATKNGCPESERIIKIKQLQEQILEVYNNYKKEAKG